MARYILKLSEGIEFEAKNEVEIWDFIRKWFGLNGRDKAESLAELRQRVLRYMSRDLGSNSIRSVIQNMLEKKLMVNISNPSGAYNTKVISKWCEDAYDGNLQESVITHNQYSAMQKVAKEFRLIADNLDNDKVDEILNFDGSDFNFDGYYYGEPFKYLAGRPVPALGVLNFIFEFLEAKCKVSTDYDVCHTIFYTQFPRKFQKFANLWKFALGLKMGREFFKAGLNFFADALTSNPNVRHDLYTDYAPRTRILDASDLYFAYGSNMDMRQMLGRCPSAVFVGLSNVKNFEYYIDRKGVASLRPKLGAAAKGILWDIRDPDDWRKLDGYEGVPFDKYRRHYISNRDLAVDQTCAVYISTTSEIGKPRIGYQEKIVNAVIDLKSHLIKDYNNMSGESFVEWGGDWRGFEQAMDLWESEMKNWLRG